MSVEAIGNDRRPRVTVQANGKSCDFPVPFEPTDRIEISALYPRAMIMIHYAKQIIAAYPRDTGEEIIVYKDGKNGS